METGYRTFWDYLPPSAMNADIIDSEKINEAIFNFFKDWTDANLSTMGTEAISQALDEVVKGFEEWVDTSLSSVTEETITPIIEELVNAFEQLADASQIMDVIGHHVYFNDGVTILVLLFKYEFLHPRCNRISQDLAAILRTEDNVILTAIHNAMIGMVVFVRLAQFHISLSIGNCVQYTIARPFWRHLKRLKRVKGLYPTAEAGGVYALISKGARCSHYAQLLNPFHLLNRWCLENLSITA